MHRLLLALPLTAVLAVPAVAAAPQRGAWKATEIQRGYDMSFKVKGSKITNVVAHVLETCDGESTSSTTTVGPGLTWKIRGNRFSGRKKESANGVTLYTTLKGRFTSRTRAKGIIRQESIVAGSLCDTFKLKFSAKRG